MQWCSSADVICAPTIDENRERAADIGDNRTIGYSVLGDYLFLAAWCVLKPAVSGSVVFPSEICGLGLKLVTRVWDSDSMSQTRVAISGIRS